LPFVNNNISKKSKMIKKVINTRKDEFNGKLIRKPLKLSPKKHSSHKNKENEKHQVNITKLREIVNKIKNISINSLETKSKSIPKASIDSYLKLYNNLIPNKLHNSGVDCLFTTISSENNATFKKFCNCNELDNLATDLDQYYNSDICFDDYLYDFPKKMSNTKNTTKTAKFYSSESQSEKSFKFVKSVKSLKINISYDNSLLLSGSNKEYKEYTEYNEYNPDEITSPSLLYYKIKSLKESNSIYTNNSDLGFDQEL